MTHIKYKTYSIGEIISINNRYCVVLAASTQKTCRAVPSRDVTPSFEFSTIVVLEGTNKNKYFYSEFGGELVRYL